MHLEPEITRFCSVQRCGLLIGICAASFSRGGNPSYARHSTFSILIAGNHSGIKIQNATDKVNPAQLAQCDDQSQVSLSSLIMIGICLIGPNIPEISRAWPGGTKPTSVSDEICVMSSVADGTNPIFCEASRI